MLGKRIAVSMVGVFLAARDVVGDRGEESIFDRNSLSIPR
jgi:hypothetical protein